MQGKLAQGKIICACKQVGINTITEAIQDQGCQSIESIKSCTGAGTGCGSCVPEIGNILADYLEDNPHIATAAAKSMKLANGVEIMEVEEFIV